ncbi:hypothetical protein CEXT_360871 [Caerostris extrusa]|uniref:Uncharacterized protein n=1 Tax=Caerostris extrusa TaxID=172846 RepID=A0AAV4TWD3_CAEEX|nr:hypothetical protein CEXT_360871 [Caerostris extrusa]
MSFGEDLKKFVHVMAFFMGVKIVVDCFGVGIFGVAVMLIVGIVINTVLDYDWNNVLAIWKRRMLKTVDFNGDLDWNCYIYSNRMSFDSNICFRSFWYNSYGCNSC